jgi:nitroreductase
MQEMKADQVLKLIRERRSTRSPFDPDRQVAKKDLYQILEAGSWAPTAHNMQNFEVIVVDDKAQLEAIASIKYPISEAFVRENYELLSFSEDELRRKKTGILGTMFPPELRSPEAKLGLPKGRKVYSFQGRNVRTGPVLLVVVYDPSRRAPASEGDFLGIMSLGCVMENMWLLAQSLGLAFHIVSALSGDRVVENEVKRILRIPEGLKIAFSVRLGYPASTLSRYQRVRRNVEDFAHHNMFGNKESDWATKISQESSSTQ